MTKEEDETKTKTGKSITDIIRITENAENPTKSRQNKNYHCMNKDTTRKVIERMNKIREGEYFRPSVRKDHDSVFELWDTVWVMYNNQPVSGKVCEINITIKPNPHGGKLGSVKYKLSQTEPPTSKNYQEYFVEIEEEKCFSTKEELINSL